MKLLLASHIIRVFLIAPFAIEIQVVDWHTRVLDHGREFLGFSGPGVVIRGESGIPKRAGRGMVPDNVWGNFLIWERRG
jgi:hypothetical protein